MWECPHDWRQEAWLTGVLASGGGVCPSVTSQPLIRCFAYVIRTHPMKVSWLSYTSHRFFFLIYYFVLFCFASCNVWKSCPWVKSIKPSLSHFEKYSKFGSVNTGKVVVKFVVLYLLGHSTLGSTADPLTVFWHFCLMLELMLDFFPLINGFDQHNFTFWKEKTMKYIPQNMNMRRDAFCWGTPYKGQLILSLIL